MPNYSVIFRSATVVDGSGQPRFTADVALEGETITAIGDLSKQRAAREIDCTGLVLAPGFIDVHCHSDLQLLANPRHEPKVFQGVTTDQISQDGLSYAPIDDRTLAHVHNLFGSVNGKPDLDYSWRTLAQWMERFDRKVACNVAFMAPTGNIRCMAMGLETRRPTPDEIKTMQRLTEECMEAGATGVSDALTYAPAVYNITEDIIEVCKPVKKYGGYYQPHLRSYGARLHEAIDEAVRIGREAGIAVQLTHITAAFKVNQGRGPEYVEQVDRARASGLDLTMDSYAYEAGQTTLHAFFPGYCQLMTPAEFGKFVSDKANRDKLKYDLEVTGTDGTHFSPIQWSDNRITSVRTAKNKYCVGKHVDVLAREAGLEPLDFVIRLLLDEDMKVTSLSFTHHEETNRLFLTHPAHMVGSDGILVGDLPHPRAYGTFPKFLGHWCRDLGLLTLEECVRKMTSFPAWRLGLKHRGLVRENYFADLCVFDPQTVRATATYENPRSYPEGIHYVFVNGALVVEKGKHTGALPGRALRHEA